MKRFLVAEALIPLFGMVAYLVLLIIVAKRRKKEESHLYFAVYLIAMLVWSFGLFMMFERFAVGSTLFWNRFMIVGSAAMPVAFYSFVRSFLRKRTGTVLLVGALLYATTLTANAAGWIITEAHFENGHFFNERGPAFPLMGVLWVFFIGGAAVDLLVRLRKTRDTGYRNRIKYLLVVIMLMIIGCITNVTVLRSYAVDVAFNVVCAVIIAYAILRFKLLDITLVFRQGLLYSIPTVVLGVAYFLVIYLATAVFHAFAGPQLFLTAAAVAVIAALAARPLLDGAQTLIDRLFFREKIDVRLMLQRLSNSVASILDLGLLTGMILDEVSNTMHIGRLALFLRNEARERYEMVAHRGLPTDLRPSFALDHTLVEWLSTRALVVSRTEIELFPQFKALWIEEREELDALGMEVYIALRAKGVTVGILAAGPKRSGLTYSADDFLTLTTLSNQTAVTIENARLYEELQRTLRALRTAHNELEKRVEERTLELAEANTALQAEVADRKAAEEIVRASLEEKKVLLAEVHHRVKNNLQIVMSLLELQAQATDDGRFREALQNSQSRIRSMALVHEKLYRSRDLAKIEFSDYVKSLVGELIQTYAGGGVVVSLYIDIAGIALAADTVVQCGLILNELMSNSLKHAFVDRERGVVRIAMTVENRTCRLIFADDGVGFRDTPQKKRSSLGMQLVYALVSQLDGSIELDTAEGTKYTILFPLPA